MNKPRLPFDIEFLVETILNENPDGVDGLNGEELTHWTSGGVCFMTFDDFSVISRDQTHGDIMQFILKAASKKQQRGYLNHIMRVGDMQISSVEGMLKNVRHGKLADYLNSNSAGIDVGGMKAKVYRSEFGLSGRIWPSKKIISFWNKTTDVIKNWDKIVGMFKSFPILGKLEEYQVDLIERSWVAGKPLVSAETISSSREKKTVKKKSPQLDFFDKLTPDQVKQLQQKVHVLPPAQKKQALIALGGQDINKRAEIAAKLGMSVAEYNHIMNVNEGEESVMPNLVDLAKQLNKQ